MTTAVAPLTTSRQVTLRHAARRMGILLPVGVMAYLVLLPLIRLQMRAFQDGGAGYASALRKPGLADTIWTTIGLALGSLTIALVLGTLLAWAATRLPPRLKFLRTLPILPIVVPAVASVVGWGFLLSPRPGYLNALMRNLPWWSHLTEGPVDVYTIPWIIIITGFGLTSFVYLFVSAGFAGINSELLEAAQTSGASTIKVFFRVTLPLLRPVLVYGGGVALLLGLGQFTAPLLLGRNQGVRVLTTDMYFSVVEVPTNYAMAAAFGSPLLLFGVAVVILQKVILGDQRRFVTHGGKAFRSSTRPSKLAAAGILFYSFIATFLPLSSLAILSFSPFWSARIPWGTFTLNNFRSVLGHSGIMSAVTNSLAASITAVAIALPIGFFAATLLLRGRRYRVMRTLTDYIVTLPLGVPAVLFGVGFLLVYTRAPLILYGSRWVIVLVYVTLMLPFATRMLLSGMIALGDSYLEASRVNGAGVLSTNLRIVLPLLRPTIGGAAALMFVLLTHEFAASLLVRSSTNQVMGTVLYDFWINGSYPTVAAIALIMTGITAVGVVAAVAVAGSDIFEKL